MIIKNQFVLQEIAGEHIIVPIGEEADRLHGIITLNDTGAFLWKKMEKNDYSKRELAEALCKEFEIDILIAENDTSEFLDTLNSLGCIE